MCNVTVILLGDLVWKSLGLAGVPRDSDVAAKLAAAVERRKAVRYYASCVSVVLTQYPWAEISAKCAIDGAGPVSITKSLKVKPSGGEDGITQWIL